MLVSSVFSIGSGGSGFILSGGGSFGFFTIIVGGFIFVRRWHWLCWLPLCPSSAVAALVLFTVGVDDFIFVCQHQWWLRLSVLHSSSVPAVFAESLFVCSIGGVNFLFVHRRLWQLWFCSLLVSIALYMSVSGVGSFIYC